VAIIAIARQLLVAVWHGLAERVADRHAVPEQIAFKVMIWSWKLNDDERNGLTSRQFIRYHVLRLNLGHDVPYVITGKHTKRAIAPPEDVLALYPEFSPTSIIKETQLVHKEIHEIP
jgi:hypothetical protein